MVDLSAAVLADQLDIGWVGEKAVQLALNMVGTSAAYLVAESVVLLVLMMVETKVAYLAAH